MHCTDKGYLHTSEHPFIHALHRYGYLNTSRHPSIHCTDMDTCILPGIHPFTEQIWIPAYSEHPLSAVPFSMVFSIFGNLHSSIKAHLTSAFRYRTLAHLLPQCFWPPRPKVEKAVDTEASSGLLVNRLSQTSANHFKIIA